MTQEGKDIRSITEDRCCGCAGCVNACPVGAITMEEGVEGFLFPVINPEICIHCGKCYRVCPVSEQAEKEPFPHNRKPECYAAASGDGIRMQSSSGGIFQVIARRILAEGGSVYGAAWQENLTVGHICVKSLEDLPKLSGSKYVQSRIRKIYRQILEELNQGKKVLFSGTPCQNAGLRRFLGKTCEGLVTVDIVCHGVPSERLFQTYLEQVHGREQVEAVSFRTKEFGHTCSNGIVTLKNGKKKVITSGEDPYERGFHKSLFLRRSCYGCLYAAPPRAADFTLGDFWGLEKYKPSLKDERGVSLVLLNTEKAEKLWTELSGELALCEKVPLDVALKNNRFRKTIRRQGARERFFRLLPVLGIEKAVTDTMENHYDLQLVYHGQDDREALEQELEQEANRLGRTVCLSGHPEASWEMSAEGLEEILKGRRPGELSEEERKQLEKLLCREPDFWAKSKKAARMAVHRAALEAREHLSSEMKERLKSLLRGKSR